MAGFSSRNGVHPDAGPLRPARQRAPARVVVVAAFHRAHVGCPLLPDAARVTPDFRAELAVGIIFLRPARIIGQVIERRVELHAHAQARQHDAFALRQHRGPHVDGPVAVHRVVDGLREAEAAAPFGHPADLDLHGPVDLLGFDLRRMHRQTVQPGRSPRLIGPDVVLPVGRAEGVQGQPARAGDDHRRLTINQFGERAGRPVENRVERGTAALAADGDPRVVAGHLERRGILANGRVYPWQPAKAARTGRWRSRAPCPARSRRAFP